ncbi:hypothetical protein DXU07_42800 [Bradyrhizobium elkanii]
MRNASRAASGPSNLGGLGRLAAGAIYRPARWRVRASRGYGDLVTQRGAVFSSEAPSVSGCFSPQCKRDMRPAAPLWMEGQGLWHVAQVGHFGSFVMVVELRKASARV